VFLSDLAHHAFRDSRSVAQSRQVQLQHFAAAADVVHQIERIPFAANESHETHPATSKVPVVYCTSTTTFNIRFIPPGKIAPKALPLRRLKHSQLDSTIRDAIQFPSSLFLLRSICFASPSALPRQSPTLT
jgi:hypothetical protein